MGHVVILFSLIGGMLSFGWSANHFPELVDTSFGTRIVMSGVPSVAKPGAPLFPQIPLVAVLPDGAVADSIKITGQETVALSYNYDPMPAQAGVPISRPEEFSFTPADTDAFSRAVSATVSLTGQGRLMGYPVADVVFCPVTWNPETRELLWTENAEFQLYYHLDESAAPIPVRGVVGSTAAARIVSSTVANPWDVSQIFSLPESELPWGEYLIIADDDLVSAFEPLAEWKTWKGIPAKIVSMSFITDLYSGVDDAQKLRFFLADIFQNNPPTYILLAGDTPGVPHRNCYATAEGYTGDPASDLYYQDMNDTAPGVDAWDLNGNGLWGELNGVDYLDYHPDYVLGRASVETVSEAETFVNKVLQWEDSPDTDDWYTSLGFTTGILWTSPYCPGSAGKEKVDSLYTPSEWSVTKLYESAGTQSYSATMAMLNTGMQLVNHAGHGSETMVSLGSGALYTSDFMSLTNVSQNGRPTIWNTIACLSGSFDTDTCLAESWIRSPGGGGFCIMNTRYGWGEPAEPGDQWSELVDQEFFANFFVEGMYRLGVAYMMAKDDFVPLIPSDSHYDWIAKSNTLFGDPELPMYTVVPDEIETSAVDIYEGMDNLTLTVTSGGSPLEGARVCLLQGEWDSPVTYAVGLTDPSGSVTLSWADPIPEDPGNARLTVWARDHVTKTEIYDVGTSGVEHETTPTESSLSLVSQNPVVGCAVFRWSLTPSETGSVSIIDLAGRTIASHPLEGEGTEGDFVWQTDRNPAGIYFARLATSGGSVFSIRVVVTR